MTTGTEAPPEESIKDVAEREAAEAEAESEAGAQPDPLDALQDELGGEEKETATPPPVWEAREVTDQERDAALEAIRNVENRLDECGDEAIVDALILAVDVLPAFTVPHEWPGSSDEEYRKAPELERIGRMLARACPKIEVSGRRVIFLWRNKKTWTKQGVQVTALTKQIDALGRFLGGNHVAACIANYQHFRFLNPLEKVRAVYHALRATDAAGAEIPDQFRGFYEELRIFPRSVTQNVHLERAIEAGRDRTTPYQLSILEGDEEGDAEE